MENNPRHANFALIFFSSLSILSTIYFNFDPIHFSALAIWAKIIPFVLLAAGAASFFKKSLILGIGGWSGIFLFSVISLLISFPTEDHILGDLGSEHGQFPNSVSNQIIFGKLITGIALSSLLVISYGYMRYKIRDK